ncbi:MAG: hypothetical protein PVG39_31260 [Desulfobacteraceae bacterium]|jgi:cell division protein FtsL
MLTVNLISQVLCRILLAHIQAEQSGSISLFGSFYVLEKWLTNFAMAALIISLILIFWLSYNHKRAVEDYNRQINISSNDIDKLREEVAKLSQKISDRISGKISLEEYEDSAVIQES